MSAPVIVAVDASAHGGACLAFSTSANAVLPPELLHEEERSLIGRVAAAIDAAPVGDLIRITFNFNDDRAIWDRTPDQPHLFPVCGVIVGNLVVAEGDCSLEVDFRPDEDWNDEIVGAELARRGIISFGHLCLHEVCSDVDGRTGGRSPAIARVAA